MLAPRTRLAAVAAALLLALAAGCGEDERRPAAAATSTGAADVPAPTTISDEEYDRSDLAAARARWAEQGRERYRVVVSRSCDCEREYLGPFVVTVVDGEVRKVEMGEGAATDETPADVLELDLTVEQVFARIEEALALGWVVDVIYDDETGIPRRAALAPESGTIEDELIHELTLLEDR